MARSLSVNLLVVVLVVTACGGNGTVVAPTTLLGPSTSTSAVVEETPTTPPATMTTTTLSLPRVDLAQPQVWYAPNMGSVDFSLLFSQPELWEKARERIDVFQFYGNTVSGFPYDIGGDNVLDTFVDVAAFERLHDWGIAVALELGVIKFFACEPESWVEYADLTISNIEANGGRVSFVAMDEPLLGGQLVENGQTCGYSIEESAQVVAEYFRKVKEAHPDVAIGTIETIPPQTADEVGQWIVALEKAGAVPAFLHLDVEVSLGVKDPGFVAALGELRDFSEERGIPFGLILTADWERADSDRGYYDSVMQWASSIAERLGRPTHLVFQSWIGPAESGLHELPVNLPEDDPNVYSHTRLILDGLGVLDG
jgi:hypothetical protein